MKVVKKVMIGIAAIPFGILLGAFALPVIFVMETKASISLRAFRRREAGHVYLVCTSRRNWHHFLKNNLIPVLPGNFRVIWHEPERDGQCPKTLEHFARSSILDIPKPYLVAVTSRTLLHRSLNEVLQGLKAHAKKSEETRQQCVQIITKTTNEFQLSQDPPL